MSTQNNIRSRINGNQLIPVVTFQANDDPIEFMHYLIHNGIECIEITLRTPEGIKAVELLKKKMDSKILVGAGTVTSFDQINQLKNIGTDFIVSPGLTPKLQIFMEDSGIPYLPGVATPSEIILAKEMGLDTLKFFPANLFGGIAALKTYMNLFPEIRFCPTGGITKDTISDFLSVKNVFAVGGSWLQSDFNKIKNNK